MVAGSEKWIKTSMKFIQQQNSLQLNARDLFVQKSNLDIQIFKYISNRERKVHQDWFFEIK